MISIEFDFTALGDKLDAITKAAEHATRPAAQAGAQVLYDEVKQRAPVGTKPHSTKGKRQTYQPGNLRKAIYQAFAEKDSSEKNSTYRISWNKRAAFYGLFVEFGTSKSAARPFLRPAFDAASVKALQAVQERMQAEISKALK